MPEEIKPLNEYEEGNHIYQHRWITIQVWAESKEDASEKADQVQGEVDWEEWEEGDCDYDFNECNNKKLNLTAHELAMAISEANALADGGDENEVGLPFLSPKEKDEQAQKDWD